MTDAQHGHTLGLPDYLDRAEVDTLIVALGTIWATTTGGAPGDLDDDLRACKRWFDPVAQGQRLRKELAQLPLVPNDLRDPGEPLTLRVDERKLLVTPEGRCALDLLMKVAPDRSSLLIHEALTAPYYRKLAQLYREWGLHRLRTVVELLAGETKPLQVAAAGVVIALLVNRCTTESRALTRFASGRKRQLIDQAFFAPVEAFSNVLAPSRQKSRDEPKLISGWMLYEARRRLDGSIVIVDARRGTDGKVWVRDEKEADVVRVLARDLARGHRLRVTPQRLEAAFDALVGSLRESLPRLAAFDLVHERPKNTDRLREQLVQALRNALASST